MPELGPHIALYWRPFNDGAIEYLLWDTQTDPILWDTATDYLLWI